MDASQPENILGGVLRKRTNIRDGDTINTAKGDQMDDQQQPSRRKTVTISEKVNILNKDGLKL